MKTILITSLLLVLSCGNRPIAISNHTTDVTYEIKDEFQSLVEKYEDHNDVSLRDLQYHYTTMPKDFNYAFFHICNKDTKTFWINTKMWYYLDELSKENLLFNELDVCLKKI